MKPKSKKANITLSQDGGIKRWDMLKTFSSGATSIITSKVKHPNGSCTFTVKPYTTPKNKWLAMLKFLWLKITVHYS